MMKNILILVLLILLLLFGLNTIQTYRSKSAVNPVNTIVTELTNIVVEPTKEPNNNSGTTPIGLQQLLSDHCDTSFQIPVSMLPFQLSPALYSKYGIKDTITCYPESLQGVEYAGSMSVRMKVKDEEGMPLHTLVLGDSSSIDWGMDNDISFVRKGTPLLTTNNISVYVDIEEPGPYGVSSIGLWLKVLAYKSIGDCFIMSSESRVLDVNGDILDLMKIYADKNDYPISEGHPKYTVTQRVAEFKVAFIQKYFATYPNNDSFYKNLVDSAVSDVNSITLKN